MEGGNSLVAVANEEIWIQATKINFNMSNAMGSVNQAHDTQLFALCGQALEWHSYARHADDGVEDGDFDSSAFGLDIFHFPLVFLDKPVILNRKCVLDLDSLGRRSLSNVGHSLLTCTIDGAEHENVVAWGESQVTQDSIYTCAGIGNEDQGGRGRLEELGHSSTLR